MALPPATFTYMPVTHLFKFLSTGWRIRSVFVCVCGRTYNSLHWFCSRRSRFGSRTAGPSRRRTPPRILTNAPPPPMNHWPPATSCGFWSRGDSYPVPPHHQTPCWGHRHTQRTTVPCWVAPEGPRPPPQALAAAPRPAPCQEGLSGCLCHPWVELRLRQGSESHHRTPFAFPCHC